MIRTISNHFDYCAKCCNRSAGRHARRDGQCKQMEMLRLKQKRNAIEKTHTVTNKEWL